MTGAFIIFSKNPPEILTAIITVFVPLAIWWATRFLGANAVGQ